MSDLPLPAANLRQAGMIQLRVIGALTLREMSTRFGRDNLGYVWLFLEPLMLGGAIGVLHLISGHDMPGGLNPFVFSVIGYIPFYLFRGIVNRGPAGIAGNQSLLYHRRITVFDIMVSRHLLEGAAVGTAMAVFFVLFGALFDDWPVEPGKIAIGMLLMLAMAHGIAMLIAAATVYTDLFERVTHLATYLLMGVTGAFFMVFWLPTDLQRAALTIPTVHLFELIREGQYGTRVPTTYDIPYVLEWIAGFNLFGMAALRKARRHMVIDAMISLQDVHKSYPTHFGPKTVLDGVNASFGPGEKVGILGQNGAGKTTLLRVIAGVEHPNRGRVDRRMSVSWPLGFAGAMHYSISGADNARFIARIYDKPVRETVEFVEDFADLGSYYRMPVRTYSSGMVMRLGFALSLAVDFDCYLVDEAIAFGDNRFGERARQAFEDRQARSALLVVSHQPDIVRAFCTTAAVLRNGRLTRYDDLDEAIAAYRDA